MSVRLNLEAPFFLSQILAPAMIAKGWGRIINIGRCSRCVPSATARTGAAFRIFLASRASDNVTGQMLFFDEGFSAG